MHQKMVIKLKNWKLFILGLIFVGIFTNLGMWQLNRAREKEALLKSFAERSAHQPLSAQDLKNPSDYRYYRAELTGKFDNKHLFFLDNKTHAGKIGYEIYSLFIANELAQPILIDRGFTPILTSREVLPPIPPIKDTVTITGMLNLPPKLVTLGKINDSPVITWPLRIEYVHLNEMAALTNNPSFFPYVLTIDAKSPYAFATEAALFPMPPERHRGYAVQWFALALTLLILSVVLNRTPK